MPPRHQSRRKSKIASRNKQLGESEVQAAWKDVYSMCVYIYIIKYTYVDRTPWMGLSWRPSSAGCLFGNVELLGYLTCQIHVHWALHYHGLGVTESQSETSVLIPMMVYGGQFCAQVFQMLTMPWLLFAKSELGCAKEKQQNIMRRAATWYVGLCMF